MKFRTEIDIPPFQDKISYRNPILMMGSCFTDNVGATLQKYLFDVSVNPFGVIYNPESLKKGIQALIHKDRYEKADLQLHNELWFSFDHYTKFSDTDPDRALEKINSIFIPAKEKLRSNFH